jgi:hypothetical protein
MLWKICSSQLIIDHVFSCLLIIIDPLLLVSQANAQFQSRPETSGSSRKGKSKVVQIKTVPLLDDGAPIFQQNKQTNGRSQEVPETPSTTPSRHRMAGSVSGQGKRVSSSFEVTGNFSECFFCDFFFFWLVSPVLG